MQKIKIKTKIKPEKVAVRTESVFSSEKLSAVSSFVLNKLKA